MSVLDELQALEERITARMRELQPLVDEYHELERAAERLSIDTTSRPARETRPARRSRRTAQPAATSPRRGTRATQSSVRSRPGGTQAMGRERRERVLELIGERPGVTVPDMAAVLGVEPPPLYRVVRKLLSEGIVMKEGKALRLS